MKLIELLVQELPKRGGWPSEAMYAMQDPDGLVKFSKSKEKIYRDVDGEGWCSKGGYDWIREGEPFERNFRFQKSHDHKTAFVQRNQYEAALAAAQQQWDGEGIPPAGCVCEYTKQSLPGNEWTECTVDYVGSSFVVYRDCYGVELTGIKGDISFRPIRSKADKKREDLAKALHIAAGAAPVEVCGIGPLYLDLADKIIAGKIPGIRIE